MSYDLSFWRYKSGITLDHQATYESLSQGESVEGVEELPILDMLECLHAFFSNEWEQVDSQTWQAAERGSFQIFTTAQFFRVDCYDMDGDDMNLFIDLGSKFGCPLYDPQVSTRFDGQG